MLQTTAVTTEGESKGNPGISLAMLIFGGIGLVLGLIALLYSAFGASLAFEGSGLVDIQAKCAATFPTYSDGNLHSYNDGSCGTRSVKRYNGVNATAEMCSFNQSFIGCSADEYKNIFALSTEFGLSCTVAAAIFCLIASVPVLLNGVFGLLNKQSPATVTAGVGIGLAIPSCCAITVCTVILIVVSALLAVLNDFSVELEAIIAEHGTGLCSPECEKSRTATLGTIKHLLTYFDVLRNINVAMIFLMFIEAIIAGVSCCTWKKTYTTVHTQQHVTPGQAPVVKSEAPVATVIDPTVQKTEVAP